MKATQVVLGKIAVKAVGCLGVLLFASTAAADSVVTYAGYECMGALPAGGEGSQFGEGAAFPGKIYTYCPLVRINSDDTSDITGIYIRVEDRSPTQQISCFAESCDGEGTCSADSAVVSGGAGNPSFVGIDSMHLASLTAYSTGYAYIYCDLPTDESQSLVYSYRATD